MTFKCYIQKLQKKPNITFIHKKGEVRRNDFIYIQDINPIYFLPQNISFFFTNIALLCKNACENPAKEIWCIHFFLFLSCTQIQEHACNPVLNSCSQNWWFLQLKSTDAPLPACRQTGSLLLLAVWTVMPTILYSKCLSFDFSQSAAQTFNTSVIALITIVMHEDSIQFFHVEDFGVVGGHRFTRS